MALRTRSFVDAHRGRTARARETLTPLIDRAARDGLAFWEAGGLNLLALVEFADGDHAAVDQVTTRMGETLDRIGTREYLPDRCEPFHLESLLALGDVGRARAEVARLEERGRIFPRLWIAVDAPAHTRARARRTRGKSTPRSPPSTARRSSGGELPFEHGWTRLVQGRLHRRAKRKRAAADALTEAAGVFERLGAPGVARAGAGRARPGRPASGACGVDADGMPRRRARRAGLTNREVAAAAFMSPKTVEANLARVYRKLGIARVRSWAPAWPANVRDGGAQT